MAETNVAQVVEVETSMGLAVLNMDHVFHILIGHRGKARLSRWFQARYDWELGGFYKLKAKTTFPQMINDSSPPFNPHNLSAKYLVIAILHPGWLGKAGHSRWG